MIFAEMVDHRGPAKCKMQNAKCKMVPLPFVQDSIYFLLNQQCRARAEEARGSGQGKAKRTMSGDPFCPGYRSQASTRSRVGLGPLGLRSGRGRGRVLHFLLFQFFTIHVWWFFLSWQRKTRPFSIMNLLNLHICPPPFTILPFLPTLFAFCLS